jgi:pyrroline-5-carboxylate reductase
MGMLSDTRITFIGGGTMAEALIRGLLRQQLVTAERITASDPLEQRRAYLSQELGVKISDSNGEAIAVADIAVLGVKPQVLGSVLVELDGRISPDTLVLSIVAGAKIGTIRGALGARAIVRVMPNTPGQIGEGIAVWTATAETTEAQRLQAQAVVGALGEEIYVEEERYLDMATALSGSGPAYVFLFIEALTDAGMRMGFSRSIAQKLALQTVRGSAIYAQETGLHPAVLRNRVTSPGGTTAEALYQFEKGGFRALVSQAVWAAYQKSKHLGDVENG